MDKAVPLHEADVVRPRPTPQGHPGWSAFFQSLSQSGQPPAQPNADHRSPVGLAQVSRFATSA